MLKKRKNHTRFSVPNLIIGIFILFSLSTQVFAKPQKIYKPFYQADYLSGQALLRQFKQDPLRDPNTQNNLPSPRAISNKVMAQNQQTKNSKGLSDMFWVWGQFLDHDIDISHSDPSRLAPIVIPKDDPIFTGKMPFSRSTINKKGQQINGITPYIDGSNIYGSSKAEELKLRSLREGKFILKHNLLPENEYGMFMSGDVRINENIALSAMHTIWVREHNRIAKRFARNYPQWTDEQLFNAARKIVVAEMQVITFNEFLPLLLGNQSISPYQGYNKGHTAQIINVFSAAAYRFGHTMLPATLLRLNRWGKAVPEGHVRLQDAFFNPRLIKASGIDSLLRGLASQVAQAIDPLLVDDIRNLLFANVGESVQGFDLAALNIQRGRDHQLPSYNAVRAALGLNPIRHFKSKQFQSGYAKKLRSVYQNTDQIDLWLGGLLERKEDKSLFGPVFTSILKYQFEYLRDADPAWYENKHFTPKEIASLRHLKLSHIIRRNSKIRNIQTNVFIARPDFVTDPIKPWDHYKKRDLLDFQDRKKLRKLNKAINKERANAKGEH